jgi:hypothetical protein
MRCASIEPSWKVMPMDANRFDAFVKALSLSAARRGMLTGLLGGGIATLLITLESEARRRANRHHAQHDESTAENRKKHKKKHRKKHKKKGTPPNQDQAPPCTDDSCPLPPGCSDQAFEDCTSALIEAMQADAQVCQLECEDGNSSACRTCLEPILAGWLPEAEACAVESCSSSAPEAAARHRVKAQSGQTTPKDWWVRLCDKPTCCKRDFDSCWESARDEYLTCMGAALVALFVGGPVAGGIAAAGCLLRLAYNDQRCQARYGCPTGTGCGEGDTCCPNGGAPCGKYCCTGGTECASDPNGEPSCCVPGRLACGGGCCSEDAGECCFMNDGSPYCCTQGLHCKKSNGPTCIN